MNLNKKQIAVVAATATLLVLSGCGKTAKTVDYYKSHLDEAKTVRNDCLNKGVNPPRGSEEEKDCEAAYGAILWNDQKEIDSLQPKPPKL